MEKASYSKPAILIDLKKDRIRIHKSTLQSIGDPDFVLLLVNPTDLTLAIQRSDNSDPRSFHTHKTCFVNKRSIELYSKFFIQNLRDVCMGWEDQKSYRFYGEIIPGEGMARFHMQDYEMVKEAKI